MGQFNNKKLQNFLGTGLVFPLELTPGGSAVVKSGWPLIKSSLHIIMAWLMGQRFFLGEFGTHIHNLLDEPNDETTKNMLITFLDEAIQKWEKRVELLDITIDEPEIGKKKLLLTLRIVNSQQIENFIWPFYTEIIY